MEITYCYDETAKDANKRKQAKFLRAASKQLSAFKMDFKFNPGGIAVWGEHWVKIYLGSQPVIEAIVEQGYTIVRQWDGKRSGHNHQIPQQDRLNPEKFATMVIALANRPFVAF
jgi:hypothetical protein